MAWIFVDKESEGGSSSMRSQMRRSMRGGYRNYGGSSAMMRGDYDHGYRQGYKEGWEDHEEETEDGYRRMRDSRGRYM